MSYESWTEKWWRWLLAIPKPSSPAADKTGEYSSLNQGDPNVWFLAGTFGGSAERSCSIPVGRAVFFPLVNYVEFIRGKKVFRDDSELVAYVRKHFDDVKELELSIDGLQSADFAKYRIQTAPFDVNLPKDDVFDVGAGPNRAAGDGYWLMLRPLSAGEHKIAFSGVDPEYGPDFKTSVTYDVRVQEIAL
jgi:hypothetical protein